MFYFEDFHVGDSFDLGSISITQEEMIAFARQYDPQPFHVDPELARDTFFGGLVASGWHTSALFMRLFVDELLNKSASLASPGVENVHWLRPVRPGDVLRGRFIVVDSKPSTSRSEMGVIYSRCEMFNQHNELVMELAGIHFFGRNPM